MTNDEIAAECSWCRKALNETIHGVGSSYSQPFSSEDVFLEVPVARSDHPLYAAAIQQGSRAYNEGYRLIFASCSEDCAQRLDAALAVEEDRFIKRTVFKPSE